MKRLMCWFPSLNENRPHGRDVAVRCVGIIDNEYIRIVEVRIRVKQAATVRNGYSVGVLILCLSRRIVIDNATREAAQRQPVFFTPCSTTWLTNWFVGQR